MFEPIEPPETDIAGCADALSASVGARRRLEAERMLMVAHWADLHPPLDSGGRWGPGAAAGESDSEQGPAAVSEVARLRHRSPGAVNRGIQVGGEGTPRVAELAVTELGMLLETTTTSAARILADSLDVRHRLPTVHEGLRQCAIEPWQARKAAAMTRTLTHEQARNIDEQVAQALTGLPFSRALAVIEAAVVNADPAAHHARQQAQAARRYVALTRAENLTGLRTMIAQGTREEIARIHGMVNQLAQALGTLGDADPLDSRRVKALVLMANPAQACLTLARAYPCPASADATPEPAPEPELHPEPQPRDGEEAVSSLGMAVLFGRLLAEGGTQVLDRLRPRTVLYLHLAEESLSTGHGVARVRDLGPATLTELTTWLGHDHLDVRPVLDPAGITPVDAYEVPPHMREALILREPYEAFPYGTLPSHRADADHTIPYQPLDAGGPPGQTNLGNLGPLGRRHHRAKTFGAFTCHQPLPGLYLWRTPSGHWYRVDHTGTQHLGRQTPEIIGQREQPASLLEHTFLNLLVEVP